MANTITSLGITLDPSRPTPVAGNGGYTRLIREGLSDEAYVRFREIVTKKHGKQLLSANLEVKSYKPSEINQPQNFFNTLGKWSVMAQNWSSHFNMHFMMSVFVLLRWVAGDPTTVPPIPANIVDNGDLFQNWNQVSLEDVYNSCDLYHNFSDSGVEVQNLALTWEFIMNNIDEDLKARVHNEISRFMNRNPVAAQSGPMAFWIIANALVNQTNALAHNVVTGIMQMGLIHFEGEDVIRCVAVLRNVLMFLGYGTRTSRCPPNLMDILYDIFLRCSNPTFVAYVRNFKDFHATVNTNAEDLFVLVQTYYSELLMKPNGWLKTTKTKSAFLASIPEMMTADLSALQTTGTYGPDPEYAKKSFETKATSTKQTTSTTGTKPSTKSSVPEGKPEKDRNGHPIDYTKPKAGESHTRKSKHKFDKDNKPYNEYWCDKCGRWGSHDTDHHEQWYEQYKAAQAERKKKRAEAKKAEAEANNDEPPSMHRASYAQVCSRLDDLHYESDQSF